MNDLVEVHKNDIGLQLQKTSMQSEVDNLRESLDHEFTPDIVCPYCGKIYTNSGEVDPGDEDLGDIECMECWNIFPTERNIIITYSTEIPKNKEDTPNPHTS